MHFQYTPYLLPSLVTTLIAFAIIPYIWWHRRVRGAPALGALLTTAAFWSLCYTLELSGADLATKTIFASLKYLGIANVPLTWFLFALTYVRKDQYLTRRNLVALALFPAVITVLALTNAQHHLLWHNERLVSIAGALVLDVDWGPLMVVYLAFGSGLVVWGAVVLARALLKASQLYRKHAIILLIAVLLPLLANLASMFRLSFFPLLDPTPAALVVCCLMLGAVLFRFRLIDLIPVAREAVIESMHDGMITLDLHDYIIDCNPAAQRFLGQTASNLLGRPFADILQTFGETAAQFAVGADVPDEMLMHGRQIELRSSSLTERQGQVTGRLVMLRDVTASRKAENALRQSRAQLAGIINTAQDAIITLDAQQRIVMFNTSAEQMFGYTADDVIGRTIDAFIPMRARAHHADYIRSFAATGETMRTMGGGRIGAVRRNGEVFPAEASISRVTVNGEDFFTVILRDITQREQAAVELRTQKQLFENLVAVARATSEKPDLEDTLHNVLRVGVALTAATRGSLFLFDADGTVTHTVSVRDNAPHDERRAIIGRVMSQGLVGWVARNRRAALVVDTQHDARWLALGEELIPTRSALAVPILSGQVMLGALILMHAETAHFTEQHQVLMQAAADQMALAVRNARSFDLQRRMVRQQTTLYEVLRMVGSRLDREAVARTAAEAITLMTGWPNVAIILPDDDGHRWTVRAVSGALPLTVGLSYPLAQGIIGRVFTTGKLQHVSDVKEDADNLFPEAATRSKLVVPLRRRERVLGVLNVDSPQLNAFDAADVSLAQSLAEAVALALDNALLYQAVADERSRLQALITASRDGIVLMSIDQRLLVINQAALRLMGMPERPEFWLGRTVREAVRFQRSTAPQAIRATLQEMRRIKVGNEPPGEGEYEVPPYTVHWYNLPVTTGDVPVGRLVILRDVTDERLLLRMRDDLTSTMVHDLRNPLTIIQGALELLESETSGPVSADQRQVVMMMRQGLNKMLQLVNSILDVNRLESGQMPLEREPLYLQPLVDEALTIQGVLASDKQLKLHNDLRHDLPPVHVDAELIERVLQNLVGNAIKFTPPGGDVHISADYDPADNHSVTVSVTDSGPGVPTEIRSRLFQKFVRGQGPGRGSGLGLAFCRLAVEAHGGKIWVEPSAGQGATFKFTLPTV
ncbi:MAG: histidine kinase N-terminal 7TM domain-containing protein [Anaerolineae bacterium]